jgi:hypothetical protein
VAAVAVVLWPLVTANAAHVYRFHLIHGKTAAPFALRCQGSTLLLPWNGRRYRPTGRVRCLLSDGDKLIGWRELTISSSYDLPAPVGKIEVRWSFTPVGYHAVSGTFSYCLPGHRWQPGGCQTRRFREKGSQWSNVW